LTTRLYARVSAAAAVLLTAGACHPALHPRWVGLSTLFTAVFFAWLARRCYAQARLERAVQQRLEWFHREDDEPFVPPAPCCSFWRHTDRKVHGPDCTRPAGARTTLTSEEEAAFAGLKAAFHRAGGTA
jgi:hypothetical protein